MNRQQAEQAFNSSLKKHIHDDTHHPMDSGVVDEAKKVLGVGEEPGSLGLHATQGDFLVALASVRSAVLDLLEEAGVLK